RLLEPRVAPAAHRAGAPRAPLPRRAHGPAARAVRVPRLLSRPSAAGAGAGENGRMPSTLPLGDPAPVDGALPASAAAGATERDFGVYLHVPFCRVRCGYCDFNTYTASEIRGVKQSDYAGQAIAEVAFARHVLERDGVAARPVSTVFFGGGTPTLLPAGDLVRM